MKNTDLINDVDIEETVLMPDSPETGFHVEINSGKAVIALPVFTKDEKTTLVAMLNVLEAMKNTPPEEFEKIPNYAEFHEDGLLPAVPVDRYKVRYHDGMTGNDLAITLRVI